MMKLTEDQKNLVSKFGDLFVNTGGNPIVELLERKDISMFSNAPAAMLQTACFSQLVFLENLIQKGLIVGDHS